MIKAVRIILRVIFVILILFSVTIICCLLGGMRLKCVVSSSMEPDIPVGSLIVTFPVSYDDISVGDDILYKTGGAAVTHRVIGKWQETQRLQTQGIANECPDPAIDYPEVIGRVRFCIPGLGRYLVLLSGLRGKILLISAALLILTATFAVDIILKRKDMIEI